MPPRSFAYWYRGSAVGGADRRGGGFANGYRGWFGLPASSRAAIVAPPEGGLGVGGKAVASVNGSVAAVFAAEAASSARPRLDFRPAFGTGGRGFGGATARSAELAPIAAGGATVGGVGRLPDFGIVYEVYSNDGLGGPLDYGSPIADVSGLEWTSAPLPPGSSFRFGVRARARDPGDGLTEENLDASIVVTIDERGLDASRLPGAPVDPRVIDLGGGRVRLEWAASGDSASEAAAGYRVQLSLDGSAAPSPPIAVPATAARGGVVSTELHGLAGGRRYAAVVLAVNARGDAGRGSLLFFTVDATPPSRVDRLLAVAGFVA